jgi:hypothetical protein
MSNAQPFQTNALFAKKVNDVAMELSMQNDSKNISFVDASALRTKLLAALEEADNQQLDFVGIKISEALDALDIAEGVGANHRAQ